MRLLCDLNEAGAAMIRDYFGIETMRANWNSLVAGEPAVASIMLHRNSLMQIAEFALIRAGARAILYRADDSITGLFDAGTVEAYSKLLADKPIEGWSIRTTRVGSGAVGSRNIHAFSGRVE